jgi:hypothetical protein
MTSHPLFCVQGDDVASQDVQKVRDIATFLLLSWDVTVGLEVAKSAPRPSAAAKRPGNYVYLSVSPESENYVFYYMISHHFSCMHEYDLVSREVQKVQDITSFLFLCVHGDDVAPRKYRRFEISHPFYFFACMKLTWHPRDHAMSPKLPSPHRGQGCSPAFGRREAAGDLFIFLSVS